MQSMKWVEDIKQTVKTYPLVLLLAVVTTIVLSRYISILDLSGTTRDEEFFYSKLIYCLLLSIGVTFGFAMLEQRLQKYRLLLQGLSLLAIVVLYFYLPTSIDLVDGEESFNHWHSNLLGLLFIGMLLMNSVIAFIQKRDAMAFWSFNTNLFHNAGYALIFVGIMCAGISLAIAAIEHLFGFDFQAQTYHKVIYTIGIIGGCYVALMFTESGLPFLERIQNFQVITRFFVQYIQIPLMFIYALIIFAYGLKILVTWNLPHGWISSMILVYSFLAILAFLLIYPLRHTAEKSWVVFFSRIIFISILAMLPLLFVAILTRINEYGFTGTRYLGLMVAIWLLIIGLYFTFKKEADIRIFPFSLLALIAFSLWMPKLNYFSLSMNSQKTQLRALLGELGISPENPLSVSEKHEASARLIQAVSSKISYLENYQQQRRYQNLFELNQEHCLPQCKEVREILSQSLVRALNPYNPEVDGIQAKYRFVKLEDGAILIPNTYSSLWVLNKEDTGFKQDYRLKLGHNNIQLQDEKEEVIEEASFTEYFQQLIEQISLELQENEIRDHSFYNQDMRTTLQLGNLIATVYFIRVYDLEKTKPSSKSNYRVILREQ